MQPGAYSVVAGALLRQHHLEIATNNLANLNTVGFKAEKPLFELRRETPSPGALPKFGPDVIQQSRWVGSHIDYSGGQLRHTGNPLDVSLSGPGFFVLQSPDGLRYTRAGMFTLNGNREVISPEGWPVLNRAGAPIRLPAAQTGGKILVDASGEVRAGNQAAGQFQVVDFPKPYPLFKKQGAIFAPANPQERGAPVANPQVVQGTLEQSNVSAISEMVGLIETARMYEVYQKILQSFDSMSDRAVNDLGRTQATA